LGGASGSKEVQECGISKGPMLLQLHGRKWQGKRVHAEEAKHKG
jgi:hypothetical protein